MIHPRHLLLAIGGLLGTVACSVTTQSTDPTATATYDLKAAQCNFEEFHAKAQACFEAYHACAIADGAALDACRSTLKTCLPPPPQKGDHGGEGARPGGPGAPAGSAGAPPVGSAGAGGPPPGGPGGSGGPPPAGSAGAGGPPPAGSAGAGGPPPAGPPPGGHGGGGPEGGRPRPDQAAIRACHEALLSSLGEPSVDVSAAMDAQHACVKAAFQAAFQARCDEITARCAKGEGDAKRCEEITARCASKVDGPPDRPGDKETCAKAATASP